MPDPLLNIKEKCEQYWNEHGICDAEVHCILGFIHRCAREADDEHAADIIELVHEKKDALSVFEAKVEWLELQVKLMPLKNQEIKAMLAEIKLLHDTNRNTAVLLKENEARTDALERVARELADQPCCCAMLRHYGVTCFRCRALAALGD